MAILKGKWLFNEVLTFPTTEVNTGYILSESEFAYTIPFFCSNGAEFTKLTCYPEDGTWGLMYGDGGEFPYGTDGNWGWTNEAFRIIEFLLEKEVDDKFYNWFTANATSVVQKLYTEYYIQNIADKIRELGGEALQEQTYTVATMPNGIDYVYAVAKANGHTEGYSEGHEAGFAEGETSGYNAGLTNGKQTTIDTFWEGFQKSSGNLRTNYAYAFASSIWGDMLVPKYDITPKNADHMFYGNRDDFGTKFDNIIVDFSNVTNNNYLFGGCYTTEIPFDVSMISDNKSTGVFSYLQKCETIKKIIITESNTFSSWFSESKLLKNIAFEGTIANSINFSSCTKLSADSIRNIVNHLSGASSAKTLTLSKTAVDTAFANNDTMLCGVASTATGSVGSYIRSEPIQLMAGETIKVTIERSIDNDNHTVDDYANWWAALCDTSSGDTPVGDDCLTYTATTSENLSVNWYFYADSAEAVLNPVAIRVRIVKIDENGVEITGDNLYSTSVVDNADMYVLPEDGGRVGSHSLEWSAAVSSKSNWNFSLV